MCSPCVYTGGGGGSHGQSQMLTAMHLSVICPCGGMLDIPTLGLINWSQVLVLFYQICNFNSVKCGAQMWPLGGKIESKKGGKLD